VPPELPGTGENHFQKDIEVLVSYVYFVYLPISMIPTEVFRALEKINDTIREHRQSTRFSKFVRAEADAALLQALKEDFNNATKQFSVSYTVNQLPA
jgi:hypothetical protein